MDSNGLSGPEVFPGIAFPLASVPFSRYAQLTNILF